MEKKNIIISSIVAGIVLIGAGAYFTVANDDSTCYRFSSTTSACSSNQTSCTPWVNGARTCNGKNVTTYAVSGTYRCSSGNTASKSATNGVCTIQYTDTQTPAVTNGGIQ